MRGRVVPIVSKFMRSATIGVFLVRKIADLNAQQSIISNRIKHINELSAESKSRGNEAKVGTLNNDRQELRILSLE